MSVISTLLQKILDARYGEEVRGSIHDAIEQCYDDVSTAKTLADDATADANTAATRANTAANAIEGVSEGIVPYNAVDLLSLYGSPASTTVSGVQFTMVNRNKYIANGTATATAYANVYHMVTGVFEPGATYHFRVSTTDVNLRLVAFFYDSTDAIISGTSQYMSADRDVTIPDNAVKTSIYVRVENGATVDGAEIEFYCLTGPANAELDAKIDFVKAETLNANSIVNCTWIKGSAYVDTGAYYYDNNRVLSSYIPVKAGDILKWVSGTGWDCRIFMFKMADEQLRYLGYHQNEGNGSIVISDADYIRVNILKTGVTISIQDVCNLYKFQLFSGSLIELDNLTAEEQLGIIPVIWQSGGIYNGSGEEYSSPTRIRTQYIEKPSNGIVYITVPQGYMARMYIYQTVDDSIEYIGGTMGTQMDDYTTNFAFEFPPEVTHFRLLAKVDEEIENTPIDAIIDGRKIAVYTDTQLVDYAVNDEVSGYIIKESDAVSDKFNAINSSDFSFIALSDIHYWHNNPVCKAAINDMANAVEIISDQCDLDYMIAFGDYIYRYRNQYDYTDGKAEMIGYRKILDKCFNYAGLPQIRLVGNHDPNSLELGKWFTMNDLWTYIGKYTDNMVIDSSNPTGSYGYIDLTGKKIRIICLNTSDFTDEGAPPQEPYESYPTVNSVSTYIVSVRQAAWFADALKNTPSDYKILILSHVPIDTTSSTAFLYDKITCNLWSIVTAYQNKETGSIAVKGTPVAYDFTDVTPCEILPYIHGHVHAYTTALVNVAKEEDVTIKGDVMRIAIPNALPYRNSAAQAKVSMTKDSTCFCVIALNMDDGILTALHYGAGVDRIIHYRSTSISFTATLVTSLDAVEWVSSDSQIATVPNNDGVVNPVASGNVLIYATDADGNREYWNLSVL